MPLLRAGVWGLLGKGGTSMVGFDHQGRGGGGLLQKVHIIKFGILKWRRKKLENHPEKDFYKPPTMVLVAEKKQPIFLIFVHVYHPHVIPDVTMVVMKIAMKVVLIVVMKMCGEVIDNEK